LRLAAELGDGIVYTGEVANLTTTIAALTQCCAEAGRAANQVKIVDRLRAAKREIHGSVPGSKRQDRSHRNDALGFLASRFRWKHRQPQWTLVSGHPPTYFGMYNKYNVPSGNYILKNQRLRGEFTFCGSGQQTFHLS
jgi:alkanesulfonate monooxygenase SsuD/methylene tetrahydromethanopterin reductase-like flavin-dependent oxidoreductase (luciferase family)